MTKFVQSTGNATADATNQSQYLTFMLSGDVFAIGIMSIKEIIEYADLTAVPMMPNSVRGVINIRGAAVPVIDLGVCFGRQSGDVGKRTCIVIVEVNGDKGRQDVGVIVDAVNEVLDIPRDQIEPPPAFGAAIDTGFIAGMGKVGERFVILIDLNHVLTLKQIGPFVEAQSASEPAAIAA
jgi:purine-binding chemotaxis protein CheW